MSNHKNLKFLFPVLGLSVSAFVVIFFIQPHSEISELKNNQQGNIFKVITAPYEESYGESDVVPLEDQPLSKKVEVTGINVGTRVVWFGVPRTYMTYGRILFKNLTSNSGNDYFIAEPNDVVADGAYRRSATTDKIGDNDLVKIMGTVSDPCYWDNLGERDNTGYKGCVPWVYIEKIEVVK